MAKVKIQGNASGTGVLTVTAPNTSTDRTITLPDEDVTLGAATPSIDDNGDATAITIDSSEKVNFNQGRLQLGHINKFIDTANYVGDAINIGSHPFANGTVIGQSYPADSPTTIKRTIHTTGTETKFFTVSGATETERVRIDQHGIKFNGDTAAANALDDYEEGTFTVTLSAVGGQSASNTCRYTKIGNMVTVDLSWDTTQPFWNVQGSIDASVTITSNLPFTPLGTGSFVSGITRSIKVSGKTENDSQISIGWQHNSATMYLGDGRGNTYSVANDVVKENTQSYVVIQGSFSYMTS